MNSKALGPACYRFKIWMNLSFTSFSTAHSNQHYCCSSPQLSPKWSQCVHPCHSQLRMLSLKCKTDLKHPGAFNASCNVLYSRFPSTPASFWSMANPQLSGFESLVAEDCIFWVVIRCLSGTGPGEGVHLIQAELTPALGAAARSPGRQLASEKPLCFLLASRPAAGQPRLVHVETLVEEGELELDLKWCNRLPLYAFPKGHKDKPDSRDEKRCWKEVAWVQRGKWPYPFLQTIYSAVRTSYLRRLSNWRAPDSRCSPTPATPGLFLFFQRPTRFWPVVADPVAPCGQNAVPRYCHLTGHLIQIPDKMSL